MATPPCSMEQRGGETATFLAPEPLLLGRERLVVVDDAALHPAGDDDELAADVAGEDIRGEDDHLRGDILGLPDLA